MRLPGIKSLLGSDQKTDREYVYPTHTLVDKAARHPAAAAVVVFWGNVDLEYLRRPTTGPFFPIFEAHAPSPSKLSWPTTLVEITTPWVSKFNLLVANYLNIDLPPQVCIHHTLD